MQFQINNKIIYLISLFTLLISCEEVVDDFVSVSTSPVPVADAWLTNKAGESYVRLSFSDNFNNIGVLPQIQNATVKISNVSLGTNTFFMEKSPGLYLPAEGSFVGEPLQTYQITITIEGESWEAVAQMPNEPFIENVELVTRFNKEETESNQFLEVFLEDDRQFRNYYLWRSRIDNVPFLENQILLNNDQGLNGEIIIYKFPEPVTADSLIEITVFSITEKANQYYRGVQQLTTNNGLSRTVPENPPSNFSGGMLGYFTVAAMGKGALIIEGED